MTLRKAAEQALAAIKSANQVNYSWACVEAVAVLEAALAEPEQEPMAWMEMVVSNLVREGVNKHKARQLAQHFAAPPQRLPLSDEEIDVLAFDAGGLPNSHLEFARAIEAKLREKNT